MTARETEGFVKNSVISDCFAVVLHFLAQPVMLCHAVLHFHLLAIHKALSRFSRKPPRLLTQISASGGALALTPLLILTSLFLIKLIFDSLHHSGFRLQHCSFPCPNYPKVSNFPDSYITFLLYLSVGSLPEPNPTF